MAVLHSVAAQRSANGGAASTDHSFPLVDRSTPGKLDVLGIVRGIARLSCGACFPQEISIMDDEQFIIALYEGVLARDPDSAGKSAYLTALKNGKPPRQLVRDFLQSAEFRSKAGPVNNRYPLDQAPPMQVELDLTPDQNRALWAHVARTWENLGKAEPYWSVLTGPKWKASELQQIQNFDQFYATGKPFQERLDRWLARSGMALPATATCAEYGCGVGRCTIWLAKRYARVVAFDISEPHIRLAQERAKAEGLHNIEFVHVKSERDLNKLEMIDIFCSTIVLQHNPPPLILSILRYAFDGVRPGGFAFFQVPTYGLGYSFRLKDYLERLTEGGLEMHYVPQRAIFELAFTCGMRPLEVSPDGAVGNTNRYISTSFLMTKPER
jgi:hypothetical protein